MTVKIKTFAVDMGVKTKGVEFEVRTSDDSKQIGDFYVSKSGVIWCIGKTDRENGIALSWAQLATLLWSDESKREALKAAKQV